MPTIPLDPTIQAIQSNNTKQINPPPPVSMTRLIVGTIIFGGVFVLGIAFTAIGIGVTFHDPFGLVLVAFAGTVAAFSAEGLYQTWRPLLPKNAPDYIIIPDFKIP